MEAGGRDMFFLRNFKCANSYNDKRISYSNQQYTYTKRASINNPFFIFLLIASILKSFHEKIYQPKFFLYFFQNLHGDCSHGRHGRIPIHRPKSYHQDSTSLEKNKKINTQYIIGFYKLPNLWRPPIYIPRWSAQNFLTGRVQR